jgi:hypothetical protein
MGMFLLYETIKAQKLHKIVEVNTMYFNVPEETKMVERFFSAMIWMQTGTHLGANLPKIRYGDDQL